MDKILLAMLLFRRSTIYEIHNYIKENMKPICSDSMGSIQAGLKKLLTNGYINYENVTENNKKKKIYYATSEGKDEFLNWMDNPITPFKNRNMDFSKIFFMGYLPIEKRIKLLKESLDNLEEEKSFYNKIQSINKLSKEEIDNMLNHTCQRFDNDPLLKKNMSEISQINDEKQFIKDALYTQLAVLDYALARNEFEIKWYKNFLNKLLKKEDMQNEK